MIYRGNLIAVVRNAIDALASVLFPAPCRVCGQPLTNASRIPICPACLASFQMIGPPLCECCGRPFASAATADSIQPLCRLCRTKFYSFDRVRSFALYDDVLSSAILLLKYEQVSRLAYWFSARLAETLARSGDEYFDLVIAVPLHPDRRRERGYNQADLIARPLAKHLGQRFAPDVLVRIKPRPPQLVLSRSEHWRSVRGAYAIRTGARVDNLRILLVDDVLTTGATLDACSRVLKKAGAKEVIGLTVGRVTVDNQRLDASRSGHRESILQTGGSEGASKQRETKGRS